VSPSPRPAGLLRAGALALAVTAARCLTSCTAAQGRAVEDALTRAGCELVAVLSHDEQVGTLCSDIAPAVEAELAALLAEQDVKPGNLMGHRERTHRRPVRLRDHAPERDPGESIEEGAPLEAALRVLARHADAGAR
jgi:hypothetical protein